MRGGHNLLRLGSCLTLLLPLLCNASRYQPDALWLQNIKSTEPFLQYRLGVIEFKEGNSDEWLESWEICNPTLRASNYFQTSPSPKT